jgi:aerobic-type carbon monoxide dehydrogenase small subunit (CoxS/CutS family)
MSSPQGRCEISLTVNGMPRTLLAYPMERLLDVLRGQLELTGVKEGCGAVSGYLVTTYPDQVQQMPPRRGVCQGL